MGDLVDRLRESMTWWGATTLVKEAADEIERLRTEQHAADEQHRAVMAEPCGDERHCACVPILRAEIERLRAFIRDRVADPLLKKHGGYHGRRIYLEAEKLLRQETQP